MSVPLKISRFKAELWAAARSWIFWIIMAVMVLGVAGLLLQIDYLFFPFVILFIGVLPLVGAGLSQKLGIVYVEIRNSYEKLLPFKRGRTFSYVFEKSSESEPLLREPVFYTMLNVFGIIYVVYAILQYFMPNLSESGSRLITILLLMLPCLTISSALNVSAWLFRLVGFRYENTDGDRMNLGKDMRSNFGRVIGIGAAILFGYMFFKSPADFGNGITPILMIIIFCTPPTLFSYYVLKKRHLERMRKEFRAKLIKYTNTQVV